MLGPVATDTVDTPSGKLAVYLAVPDGSGPWPGVVGMSQDLRNQADWLAREGLLAAAPDLFHGRRPVRCMISIMRQARSRHGRAFDDVEAVRKWLSARADCTPRWA